MLSLKPVDEQNLHFRPLLVSFYLLDIEYFTND